jgi:2-polyprenyl-3-methyl-5-hydroxy-6-metoxy-1,4-benzoquinol methylase
MTLTTVPCAVCRGMSFAMVHRGTIDTSDAQASEYFGSSRRRAGYLPIVRCVSCGLMMTNPQDDAATLSEVYSGFSDPIYEAEYENRRQAALDHLTVVTSHHPARNRMLDVGCATGAFVCVALEAGWQVTGLDSSEWMIAHGRARCPRATFKLGGLRDVDFPARSFDAITMWDVLEHVASPLATLHRVRGWLAPRGWLCLSVPNGASLTARLMGRRWVLLLREHLWYFGPETMGRLLAEAGFDLVETRPKLVRFSVANILTRLGQYPGAIPARAGRFSRASVLRRISVRFPIGEMDVVARARS